MADNDQPDKPAERDDDLLDGYLEEEVREDLDERQQLDQVGREVLRRRLREHTSESPVLTGGDLDAAWDNADGGEEVVGGESPTPDQDVVDELGKSAGLTYEDDEPLNYAKVSNRDRHRWELNPASALDADKDEPEAEEEVDLKDLGIMDDDNEAEAIKFEDIDDLVAEVEEEEQADGLLDPGDEEDEEPDEAEDDEDDEDDDEEDER